LVADVPSPVAQVSALVADIAAAEVVDSARWNIVNWRAGVFWRERVAKQLGLGNISCPKGNSHQ